MTAARSDLMALADQATLIVYNCTGKIEHQWQRQLIEKINKALRHAASQPDREALARIIDPVAFNMRPEMYGLKSQDELEAKTLAGSARNIARTKAGAILSLLSGAGTESDGIEVYVKPMELADNRTDYFVAIKVGDREVTPHVFRDEYKAAYHVALYNWLLNGSGEEPELMDFNENDWPARITRPSDPSPGSDVSLSAPVGEPVHNLHPKTANLVRRFSNALAKKLWLAEVKYGFGDGWAEDHWERECLAHFHSHIEKGDPLDVAAYCAFMWHHRWITYPSPAPAVGPEVREKTIRAIMERLSGCSFPLRVGAWHEETASLIFDQVAAALTRPLGGFVQGSIATKQESRPESALRTETDVRWAVNYLLEQIAAKFEAWDTMDLWRSDAASLVRSFKHDLTKTPSAGHDAGNPRGLAEPTPRDSSESTTGGVV